MKLTVFTPTYNRGYCLPRLFDSLQSQTFRDFEWVVIDDGSTDDTAEILSEFTDRSWFPIKYKKTENGGKHRAINYGVQFAEGEMILFMDSDDWLRCDALEWIVKIESTIPEKSKSCYAGVQGLRCYPDESLIGTTFKGEVLDSTTIDRKKYGILGDKAEVYYTYLIKKYPFPEFSGEKFATERLVWNQIAAEHKLVRYFNEKIYYCEYLPDGLTYSGNKLYAANPQQWGLAIYQDYMYKDTNLYNTTIQVYIYNLWVRNTIGLNNMSKYLNLPVWFINFSVILQFCIDVLRYVFTGRTIKSVQRLQM